MNEDLKKQLDDFNSSIDAKVEKAAAQALASANGKAEEVVKGEIKNIETQIAGLHDRFDAVEKSNQLSIAGNTVKSFQAAMAEEIKKGALDSLINGNSKAASFDIKAVDMTVANSFTGEVIPAQYVQGIKYDPTRRVHVRQLLPQGSTVAEVVRYIRETGYTNGSAPVAQGGLYPESDFALSALDANVRKIGTYFRISEEMLADTAQLTSYLAARAPEKLLTVEDAQILSGNGTGQNLDGLFNVATAFDAGDFAGAVQAANQFDVLTVAVNQLALAEYAPDYIMINPTDFSKMVLGKATTNEYLQEQVYMNMAPSFMGIPLIKNTAIPAGQYLVGNFAMATQFWIRQNLSLEFFREDRDNVIQGFVTVRVSERVALTTYSPLAIVAGTFATDIAAISVV